MSSRTPEKAIVMRSTGKALVPTDVMSEEAIEKIKGKEVLVYTERARSPKHHAKFMAMLKMVVDNQSTFQTTKQLLNYIKWRTGHTDSFYAPNIGQTLTVPASISFASMSQDEFETFYERAIDIIITEVIPGLRRSALKEHVLEMVGGSRRDHPSDDAHQ